MALFTAEQVNEKFGLEFALDKPAFVNSLNIYPVKLKDILGFYSCYEILKMNKAEVNPKYIKMSYYNFLCDYIITLSNSTKEEDNKKSQLYILFIASLFTLVLRKQVWPKITFKDGSGEIVFYTTDKEEITEEFNPYNEENNKFTVPKEDFELMRSVIIYQNNPDFINLDEYSKDIQQLIKEDMKKRKGSSVTLEDKVDSLMVSCGYSSEEISEMTVRRFNRLLDREIKKMDYQIIKTGLMSGLVSFKDKKPIDPWYSSITKDPLEGLLVDYEEQKNKFK